MENDDKYGLYIAGVDPYKDWLEGYYIPEIEELRVGYELEMKGMTNEYTKMIITKDDNLLYDIYPYMDKIRVPFLTKSQIEAEGWEDVTHKHIMATGSSYFQKKEYDYQKISYLWSYHFIHIQSVVNDTLYQGECKSINEFRYICKLLKI